MHGELRAIFDTSIGIHPELTGRENAYLLAEFMFPYQVDKIESIVEAALKFSELGDFLSLPYKIYSNGMQARLCLSLISSVSADLIILDEVFDGADQYFQKKIAIRVKDMIEKSGAVLFVSHSPATVMEVCNRVVVLNKGQVTFDGPAKEGIHFYQNLPKPKDQFAVSNKG